MEVAAGGLGFSTVHSVVDQAALKHSGLKAIAKIGECGSDFFAITTALRVKHPAAVAISGPTRKVWIERPSRSLAKRGPSFHQINYSLRQITSGSPAASAK